MHRHLLVLHGFSAEVIMTLASQAYTAKVSNRLEHDSRGQIKQLDLDPLGEGGKGSVNITDERQSYSFRIRDTQQKIERVCTCPQGASNLVGEGRLKRS